MEFNIKKAKFGVVDHVQSENLKTYFQAAAQHTDHKKCFLFKKAKDASLSRYAI